MPAKISVDPERDELTYYPPVDPDGQKNHTESNETAVSVSSGMDTQNPVSAEPES